MNDFSPAVLQHVENIIPECVSVLLKNATHIIQYLKHKDKLQNTCTVTKMLIDPFINRFIFT